jgi:carbonic anhydrase/acetyltransferase-like protein (isoleucine patch superfamily)
MRHTSRKEQGKVDDMIMAYQGKAPRIGNNVFIAPTAAVIGDVEIADGVSIWYGAVIRGDLASIRIGADTNIQDNCTIHVDRGRPAVIGQSVVVGHNAVVHGCTIEDQCLIGINAVVLNGAQIRRGSIVAAGAVVLEDQMVGPLELAAGMPARVRKQLPDSMTHTIRHDAEIYLDLARQYAQLNAK